MESNKSPGSDGLPAEFYKVFWNDVHHYLLTALNCAYAKEILAITQRRGLITLLPTSETISDSAECSMHSSHAELITPFLYNPCRSLLVCIDLGSQLGILTRHKLSSVYVL